jgi:hypothetical protein
MRSEKFLVINNRILLNNQPITNQATMEGTNIIYGEQIQNIITKLYFNNSCLYYQIVLLLGAQRTIFVHAQSDYCEYKRVLQTIIMAKKLHTFFSLPSNFGTNDASNKVQVA